MMQPEISFVRSLRLRLRSVQRMLRSAIVAGVSWIRAWRSLGVSALDIDLTGRRIGLRMLARGEAEGWEWLLHPIESVRYVEFAFANDRLSETSGPSLDISSPRLFSLHRGLGHSGPIEMWNPDADDCVLTRRMVKLLRLPNVTVRVQGVENLREPEMAHRFGTIWSLSVVEHIEGAYSDSDAVRWMYRALRPGGRLVLTVPVDRAHRVQKSVHRQYGTQPPMPDGGYFFQRFYDEATLRSRLVDSIGAEPIVIKWFGEREAGAFERYRTAWAEQGLRWGVGDVDSTFDIFTEYGSFEKMPGFGICGLVFEKPCSCEIAGSPDQGHRS